MTDTGRQIRSEALSWIPAVLIWAVVVRDIKMTVVFLGACVVTSTTRLAWVHHRRHQRSEDLD